MYFDRSKRVKGARAGVVLISPQGDKLKYVLRMSFPQASNNEAEYEALLHGLRMAKACGATRLKIFSDSNLVVHQVMNRCDAVSDNMTTYMNLYYYLEGTFNGCEVSHVSRASYKEDDILANIGSQCLPVPPGVFWEEIIKRSIKEAKTSGTNKHKK
jgi:ribonuclease HI